MSASSRPARANSATATRPPIPKPATTPAHSRRASTETPAVAYPDPARHAERDVLVRALAGLSPQRRRVVVLRYVMDLSEQQVADDLNVSVGAVKSAASRGLRDLRRLLGETDGTAVARTGEA